MAISTCPELWVTSSTRRTAKKTAFRARGHDSIMKIGGGKQLACCNWSNHFPLKCYMSQALLLARTFASLSRTPPGLQKSRSFAQLQMWPSGTDFVDVKWSQQLMSQARKLAEVRKDFMSIRLWTRIEVSLQSLEGLEQSQLFRSWSFWI